jgi:hypothetical protein
MTPLAISNFARASVIASVLTINSSRLIFYRWFLRPLLLLSTNRTLD